MSESGLPMGPEASVAAMPDARPWSAPVEHIKNALGSPENEWNDVMRRSVWQAILAEKSPVVSLEDFALQAMFAYLLIGFITRGDYLGALRFLDTAIGPIDYSTIVPLVSAESVQPPRSGVYFVRAGDGGPIKIGTARNVNARLDTLQIGSSEELTLLALIPGDEKVERKLHREFRHLRIRGEWFEPAPELLARIAELSSVRDESPS